MSTSRDEEVRTHRTAGASLRRKRARPRMNEHHSPLIHKNAPDVWLFLITEARQASPPHCWAPTWQCAVGPYVPVDPDFLLHGSFPRFKGAQFTVGVGGRFLSSRSAKAFPEQQICLLDKSDAKVQKIHLLASTCEVLASQLFADCNEKHFFILFFSFVKCKCGNPGAASALGVLGDARLLLMCLPCTPQLPHLILYFARLLSASSTSLNLTTQLGPHRYCSWFYRVWKSCGWRQELVSGHLTVRAWFCLFLVCARQVQFRSSAFKNVMFNPQFMVLKISFNRHGLLDLISKRTKTIL